MRIRQADIPDADALALLFDAYRQFYGQESNLAGAREFIGDRLQRRDSLILLAENEAGTTLGFTQLYPSFSSVWMARIWILNDLFVVPAAHAKGVGGALLEAAASHAAASGAFRLVLATAHDNPAQRLYERQGYALDKHFRHYAKQLES